MVSLWPFKGEDNSPASFERALETLSGKITRANTRLDTHRQNARRFKALWTLYTTFAYLLYSIILALVLGWQNFGVVEYAAIAGGPVVIYAVRATGSKYFEYRINSNQRYLDDLQKQRDETIEKLKVATKYNSTQQLLEKYGAGPKRTKSKSGDDKRKSESKRKSSNPQQQQPPVQRTGLPPPPTANIRRPTPVQSPGAPSPDFHAPPSPYPPQPQIQQQQPVAPPGAAFDEPGFAPNAFPSAPQYIEQSHWYDRLMDVLLGEDETQPKNRIVLICNSCRLVNGQAPPGIKSLEELGRWRCGSCGAWNGVESEAKKVLDDIRNESQPADGAWEPVSKTDAENHSSVGDVTDEGVMVATSEDDQVESHDSDADTADKEPEQVEEEQPEPESKTRPVRRSNRKKA